MPTPSATPGVTPVPHSAKNYLNLDKAVAFGVRAAYQAMQGWLRGRPLDEVALMSRLIEKLVCNKCPPWRSPAYELDRDLFLLHRKGKKQVDKYGADFAVTINIFDERRFNRRERATSLFSKTALFQLKKGDNYDATLTKVQLKQAGIFANRSFVLYAHESAGEYRIKAGTELLAEFTKPRQQSKKFNAQNWCSLSEWLVLWLTCQQGAFSDNATRLTTELRLTSNLVTANFSRQAYLQGQPPLSTTDNERAFARDRQEQGVTGRMPAAWVNIDLFVQLPPNQL